MSNCFWPTDFGCTARRDASTRKNTHTRAAAALFVRRAHAHACLDCCQIFYKCTRWKDVFDANVKLNFTKLCEQTNVSELWEMKLRQNVFKYSLVFSKLNKTSKFTTLPYVEECFCNTDRTAVKLTDGVRTEPPIRFNCLIKIRTFPPT